jgi:hypothetical protein
MTNLQLTNSITSVTYATWNPSNKGSQISLSGGNLIETNTTSSNTGVVLANTALTGKKYWEYTMNTASANMGIGVIKAPAANLNAAFYTGGGIGMQDNGGRVWVDLASFGGTVAGYILAIGGVFGLAFDAIGGTLQVFYNGISIGTNPYSGFTGGGYFPAAGTAYAGSGITTITANFGASPMVYTPPAGYSPGVF